MDVLPLHTADSPRPRATIPGLDAVRALAALGVVLLHSCVPYLKNPMPGLVWPVRDSTSSLVDIGFWTIELFIMPLFLVLAGMFAWNTLARRGTRALVKSRARRLLIPLLFGMIVILPLDLYCWVLGWVADGTVAPVKLRSLKFDAAVDRELWGLSHLWFLQYLFLYVVAASVVTTVSCWARFRFAGARRWIPRPSTFPFVLLSIAILVLYLHPEVVWGFQHSFAPLPSKWVYSGIFFAFGAMLGAWDGELLWLKARATRLAAPAIACTAAAVILGRWYLSGDDNQNAQSAHYAQFTLAALTAFSALLVTMSIIGMAARIDRISNSIRYLAAASFWVYLVHHPVVGLVHIDLKFVLEGVHPAVKTALAFGITSGVCLLTYEGLVRRSALGRMLGFAWKRPTVNSFDGPDITIESGHQISAPPVMPPRRAA